MNPIEFALNIPGWMRDIELQWLSDTASKLPEGSTWLEVGTWMGRSWAATALSLPANSTIICVDTFMGECAEPQKWCKENGSALPVFKASHEAVCKLRPDIKTQIVVCSSVDAARKVARESCDAIFIDSDHSEEGLVNDIRAWKPKLKQGGLMCGHDGDHPGVLAALAKQRYTLDPSTRGSIWCLR